MTERVSIEGQCSGKGKKKTRQGVEIERVDSEELRKFSPVIST